MVKERFRNEVATEMERNGVALFSIMKDIILVRQTDRSFRQNTFRAVKQILKVGGPAVAAILYKLKFHVYVTFILEREYKSISVAKERLQCFKLMQAWLRQDPTTFPLLFAQAIVSIVRNEEEFQLRFSGIDLMLDMCFKAPREATQVGSIKLLVDCLIDVSLEGYRYEKISHTLMILINDPQLRIYFRPLVDLNKIFWIFTRCYGLESDPRKVIMERIE